MPPSWDQHAVSQHRSSHGAQTWTRLCAHRAADTWQHRARLKGSVTRCSSAPGSSTAYVSPRHRISTARMVARMLPAASSLKRGEAFSSAASLICAPESIEQSESGWLEHILLLACARNGHVQEINKKRWCIRQFEPAASECRLPLQFSSFWLRMQSRRSLQSPPLAADQACME